MTAEQTVWYCRFSLSDTGMDIARQLQDKGKAVCPSLASPDSTAAGNRDISAALTSDLKECDTFSSALPAKRKKTPATKNKDQDRCRTLVRTVLHVTPCQQVHLVSTPVS